MATLWQRMMVMQVKWLMSVWMSDSEIVPGSGGDTNGALFYPSEATCNGISCPLYEEGMELSCAVCTR